MPVLFSYGGWYYVNDIAGEIRDPRDTAHAPECPLLQDSDSARVVAAVLEAPQALGQQGSDIAAIHCSYDSAHGRSPDFAAIRTTGQNYSLCCIATKHRHDEAVALARGAKR